MVSHPKCSRTECCEVAPSSMESGRGVSFMTDFSRIQGESYLCPVVCVCVKDIAEGKKEQVNEPCAVKLTIDSGGEGCLTLMA